MDGNPIGRDFGVFTVASGQITGLTAAVTDACIGLYYKADFKSVRLGALSQNKRLVELGLVLLNTHSQGLKYGTSFDKLYQLSKREEIRPTTEHHIWTDQETSMTPVGGEWKTDARLCLRAEAPKPCTVSAAIVALEG
jgi:hypothetical protein